MNYFVIEGSYTDSDGEKIVYQYDHSVLMDENNESVFAEFYDFTYDEMKNSEMLDDFVAAVWEASVLDEARVEDMVIVLVDEDDTFVWSIMMGVVNDELMYILTDWKKDGKIFKFAIDN
jgi:hypothetical protein